MSDIIPRQQENWIYMMLISLFSVLYWFLCGKNKTNNLSNHLKVTNVCTKWNKRHGL